MNELQGAFYARVSSDQQADAKTIASQIADLQEQITADGLPLATILAFIDDGYSGATLARPALEQLRDLAATGRIDRLYVHCPDRLARNYAHQVILLEEFQQEGVEVCFLNRPVGSTPEDQLLVQVQGVIAEYERAKFLERSRRGKRYSAQSGNVAVLCHAPYGYRYLPKHDGKGPASFAVMPDEARVVQAIFCWVGVERCTLEEVRRRLAAAGILTPTGQALWSHKTVWDMLQNPTYKGEAAFGKTRSGPLEPRFRAPHGRPAQSKRGYSPKAVPADEWIIIPVPALVDEAVFVAAQAQLQENRQRARIPLKGTRYLLQGLIVCAQCGYTYYGRTNDERNAYYRCSASDAKRHGGVRLCWNPEIRMDQVDQAVWQEVCEVLKAPTRVEQEYRRRVNPTPSAEDLERTESSLKQLHRSIERLIDSYAEGFIEKQEFEPRVMRLRERVRQRAAEAQHLHETVEVEQELRWIVGQLERFARQVQDGLQQADWGTRRDIIRALVKRVEIAEHQVRVVFRLSPISPAHPFEGTPHFWQHCGGRVLSGGFQADNRSHHNREICPGGRHQRGVWPWRAGDLPRDVCSCARIHRGGCAALGLGRGRSHRCSGFVTPPGQVATPKEQDTPDTTG